jgi:hypothetical protein
VYEELPDHSGFRIEGSDHIYKFDEDGGWEDEFGNYYNSEGKPLEEGSRSGSEWGDEDEFERHYGPDAKVQEEFENQHPHSEVEEHIARNKAELEHHQKHEPLRVNFEVLDVEVDEGPPTAKSLYQHYRRQVKGILNVLYDMEEEGHSSCGYFVVKDVEAAAKLVELESKKVAGYEISFEVETFDELLNDPLSPKELESSFPTYVSLNKDEKLYELKLNTETGGFTCSKEQFIEWLKQFGLSKDKIVKIIRNEEGNYKIPILLLTPTDVAKITEAGFGDHKVIVEVRKSKKKYQEKVEEEEHPKPEEGKDK